eukprot:1160130-Pelagomonas_calceolata.AAC.4
MDEELKILTNERIDETKHCLQISTTERKIVSGDATCRHCARLLVDITHKANKRISVHQGCESGATYCTTQQVQNKSSHKNREQTCRHTLQAATHAPQNAAAHPKEVLARAHNNA